MVEWTVQIAMAHGPANIRAQKFATKREALAFLRGTPHSFIRRFGRTYTIYPKGKAK